ncbi:MAG: DUF4910 domain-containing protein [Candidatus Thorarchaeota archaeon]|nr:DUF4910 domain-containing protein [Candidatus Thorarchaeota archaeon]
MLPDDIVDSVFKRISGISAVDYVAGISTFHRIQGSPGIHNAIHYVKQEIEKISNAAVKIFEYPADGKSAIELWNAPYGWYPKSGVLELIEPERKILADFAAEPISLIAHSRSAEMESEVAFVGKGAKPADWEGKDIKGKIVLTENRARRVHKSLMINAGASGVLTYIPTSGNDEIASIRRYDAFWPNPGEDKATGFGFSLTQADGLQIKKWLEEGKTVKVRAKVDAKLGEGKVEVLSALLEGDDTSKEIWVMGHICHPHPGANDNASGSGAILEALRTISALLVEGTIPKLEYSIRFIWMPEWSGTIPFIHNEQELLERCIGVVNADMVGANPAKSGSVFHVYRTPYSLPTTFNNVARYWMETEARRKPTREQGGTMCPLPVAYETYSAGSDHFMFTDSTVGIPSVMLGQFPDRFYHTSTDTIDKIDPIQMAFASRVVALIALSYAMPKHVCKEQLLTLTRNEFSELMRAVVEKGVTQLARCIGNPEEVYPRVLRWLGHAQNLGLATLDQAEKEWKLITETRAVRDALKTSLQMVYTTEMVVARKAYEGACAEVGLEAVKDEHIDLRAEPLGIEVKRKFKYAMDLGIVLERLAHKEPKYLEGKGHGQKVFESIDEMLNLAVDWTSLEEIWDALSFQFGYIDSKVMIDMARDLAEAGLLDLREA